MATSERLMPVPPQAVWDALADPAAYGHWVLGSKHVRGVEGRWPDPGARFHHTIGIGPLELQDDTLALAADPPRLLRMRARARPFGTATVTLRLAPEGVGTRVTMVETPDGTLPKLLAGNPLADRIVAWRNDRSLARLERLARGSA